MSSSGGSRNSGRRSLTQSVMRRIRGEPACAECRRLKIRCDKKVPCESCVRRGCEHLCPNGTKVTADGAKIVLAATNHLHADISALRDRIRDLEGGLDSLHHTRTRKKHPLLVAPSEEEWEDEDPMILNSTSELGKQPLDDCDALASGPDGTPRIYGSVDHALVHIMLSANEKMSFYETEHPEYDIEVTRYIRHFPFVPDPLPDTERVLSLLRAYLPDRVTWQPLLDHFSGELGSTVMAAFTPDYIENTLMPAAFHGQDCRGLHALSAFFALLALGSLFVVPGPGEAPEVHHFGRLSAAANSAAGAIAAPCLELIEALYARGMLEMLRQTSLEETARSILSLACQMCYDIGLHRDGSQWKDFTSEEILHRRMIFWMVLKTDAWESLVTGRPARMAFDSLGIDTEIPRAPNPVTPVDVPRALARAVMLIAEIAFVTQWVQPPSYEKILQLDEEVRAQATPHLESNRPALIPPASASRMMLHRGFFLRALAEHPEDPSKSEFSVSVHAALRGARETLTWLGMLMDGNPGSCARMHHVWSAGFAAATVYICVLERAPQCPQATVARWHLENTIDLFAAGAKYGSGYARQSQNVLEARLEKLSMVEAETPSVDTQYLLSLPQDRLRSDSPQTTTGKNELTTLTPSPFNHAVDDLVLRSPPRVARPSTRALKRMASLPSIITQTAIPSEHSTSSPADRAFYPSYLQRPPVRRGRRQNVAKSGSRGDPLQLGLTVTESMLNPRRTSSEGEVKSFLLALG